MELDELKQELQKYKDLRDKAIKDGADFGWLNEIIADYEQQVAAFPQPEIELEPEPKAIEVKLPVDYNLIFGNPNANQEISNLILQTMEQMTADHKAELQEIYEEHQQIVAGLNSTINLKQSVIDVGKPENERLVQLVADLESKMGILVGEKKDAENKRDAAVSLKEDAEALNFKLIQDNASLNGQINELEGLLQTYKKPAAAFGLSLTTTLKPETDVEKQARLDKEKLDLVNRNLSRFNIEPLPTKDELVTSKELDAAFREMAADPAVVSSDAGGDRVQETAEDLQPPEDGSAKNTIEQQLRVDVATLQQQMDKVLSHLFN